ncbi:MAG: CaiB/BaiF CoA transferase family protein [Burkholderiales bacterium]
MKDTTNCDMPFAGVRVVDFSGYIAGPYCTMLLGDMGADVIKVEPPTGEQWRHQNPFATGESLSFMSLNRNKRSVVLNLKEAADRELALELVASADVLVHNWRPGVAEKFGLGYEQLAEKYPKLIYATNSAYGPKGPHAAKGGYDLVIQARSGLMAANPAPDGGVPKRYAGIAVVDFTAGNKLAYGVVCALFQRMRTGRGSRVDSSLMEAALGLQRQKLIIAEKGFSANVPSGSTAERLRRESQAAAAVTARELYYRTYGTSDGFVTVGCLNVPQRLGFLKLVGIVDPWHGNPDEVPTTTEEDEVRRELTIRAERIFETRSTSDWVRLLEEAGLPCAPVQIALDVLNDPQVLASDYMCEYAYPGLGIVRSVGSGVRVGDGNFTNAPPPMLGQHTDEVISEIRGRAEMASVRHA